MLNFIVFNRLLTIEFRNGVGLDLEFVDSRPVWIYNHITEEHTTAPFEGVVICLPFICITFGKVYSEEKNDVS